MEGTEVDRFVCFVYWCMHIQQCLEYDRLSVTICWLSDFKKWVWELIPECLSDGSKHPELNMMHYLSTAISIVMWTLLLSIGSWDFPGSPVVKTPHFPCRGHRVWSLVGKLSACCLAWPKEGKRKKGTSSLCLLLFRQIEWRPIKVSWGKGRATGKGFRGYWRVRGWSIL